MKFTAEECRLLCQQSGDYETGEIVYSILARELNALLDKMLPAIKAEVREELRSRLAEAEAKLSLVQAQCDISKGEGK